MKTMTKQMMNGMDTQALKETIETVKHNPDAGATRWSVTTNWMGGTRSDTTVRGYMIGGEYVPKDFTIPIDEPLALCGTNQFANPQEHLMAAMNACMMVGYVAACSMEGIELEELSIQTEGDIDLRGFLGVDPKVKPGYESLHYTVHIKGNGTMEQFERIHKLVKATSPNYYNVANAITLNAALVVHHD